ncbi:uroporphyrinogen-III synthase [Rhodobacterales bacterium]|nr:uroporphyrinogen-III synthase [Rhodobacterales bacterium]
MRILVTRPEPDCARTANSLRALGHVADEAPLLVFRELAPEPIDFSGVSSLAFSSRRAVSVIGRDVRFDAFRALPVFTVGEATSEACRQAGFSNIRTADGDVASLGRLILQHRSAIEGGSVLYPAARDRAGDLEGILSLGGLSCQTVAVYRMAPVERLSPDIVSALDAAAYDGISIYSRRTAETFVTLLKVHVLEDRLSNMRIFAISKQASAPFSGVAKVGVAPVPTEKALFETMLAEC